MRYLVFAPIVAVVLSTGQFGIAVFSDLDNGHWETEGPPGVDFPDIGDHPYAHHDHIHIHDHSHGHHPHAEHHPHHHHLAIDGEFAGEVLHHCETDGLTKLDAACICKQDNGLFKQICAAGDYCDNFTGRCQKRSCFDACRWANPEQDDEGKAARDACYEETCGCDIPDPNMTEEERCRLDCADCGAFPVDWPMIPAHKAAKHEDVMRAIFGSGLEHASDYNVRSMRPLETLSRIMFTGGSTGGPTTDEDGH